MTLIASPAVLRPAIPFDGAFPRDRAAEAQVIARDRWDRFRAASDRASGYKRLEKRIKRAIRRPANIHHPQTFNEKINWRKLYQHDPVFPRITDKYLVRGWLEEQLGAAEVARICPPLLDVVDTPETIRFRDLPANMVLKCTHGSGFNILIRETMPIDHALAVTYLRSWLLREWRPWMQEWAYRRLPRRVIIEEMLFNRDGTSADDLKLHFFHGRLRLVEYKVGHFENRRTFRLSPRFVAYPWMKAPEDPLPPKPEYWDEVLALGRRLSAGFDHIRVDFLTTDQGWWLGELTLYPTSGMRQYRIEADKRLGGFWKLPGEGGAAD